MCNVKGWYASQSKYNEKYQIMEKTKQELKIKFSCLFRTAGKKVDIIKNVVFVSKLNF